MESGIHMPIFENASEAVCGRDASRTEKVGRKVPESMFKSRINTHLVTKANREL